MDRDVLHAIYFQVRGIQKVCVIDGKMRYFLKSYLFLHISADANIPVFY
jgi:hypothetical protein